MDLPGCGRPRRFGARAIVRLWRLLPLLCAMTLACQADNPSAPVIRSGTITVHTQTSLDSLEGVQTIDGSLSIGRPTAQPIDDPVRDLSPLRNLQVVTYHFSISRTDSLRSLAPLSRLRSVGGIFTISSNANVTSLAPLRALHELGGDLWVQSNPRLKSLDGLQGLRGLPGACLDISYNDSLQSLVGLDSLQYQFVSPLVGLRGISISHNRALRTLRGLEGLRSVTALSVWDSPALVNLEGIQHLRRAGSVSIVRCPLVTDLSAIAALDSCGNFGLSECPVSDLTPLKDVALGYLGLDHTLVSTLASFSRIADMDGVGLIGNTRLTNCAGLKSVERMRSLRLSTNDSLTSLAGFGGVRGLQVVDIDGNRALCSGVIQAWLDTVSVAETPYVANNGDCRK